MSFIKSHQKLEVWIKSMELAVELYNVTESFPVKEQYSSVSQLRRAGSSIPSNISEGAARDSNKEYIRFLYIALGSCAEVDTQVQLCQRVGLIPKGIGDDLVQKIDEVYRILNGLIRYRKSLLEEKEKRRK
ncbi:four helix bundle protein [Myroides marinus]|uniref:four helix bundle protein n=2 Tax=Myroides marinus TaxID=703342 RepID=UPI002576CED7|nr:four helix bundle protein [Myroides marinus]